MLDLTPSEVKSNDGKVCAPHDMSLPLCCVTVLASKTGRKHSALINLCRTSLGTQIK